MTLLDARGAIAVFAAGTLVALVVAWVLKKIDMTL